MEKQSQYFQTIARRFIEQRGTPFFLSSKEVEFIAKWEKMGIPLRLVIEGIKETFISNRMKSGKKKKIMSLTFCDLYVQRAFEQHRDRKVGQKGITSAGGKRDERIRKEVERFLECIPDHLDYLYGEYVTVQKKLSQGNPSEEYLEQADKEIEELIIKNTSREERTKIGKEVEVEFPFENQEEFDRIFRIRLIKHTREKYKIPHISPFYY